MIDSGDVAPAPKEANRRISERSRLLALPSGGKGVGEGTEREAVNLRLDRRFAVSTQLRERQGNI